MNINEGNFTYFKMFDKTNKIPFILADFDYKMKLNKAEHESVPFTMNLDGAKFVIDLHKLVNKFDIAFGDPISVTDFEKMPIENRKKLYTYVYPNGEKKPKNKTLEFYIKELLDKNLISKEELAYDLDKVNESLLSYSDFKQFFFNRITR